MKDDRTAGGPKGAPSHRLRVSRWVDGRTGEGLDAHLGEVFRAVPDEEPLSQGELASVGWRIARDGRSGARRPSFRHLPLVFAVLVGGAGAAFAEWARPGFWHLQRSFAPRVIDTAQDPDTQSPRKALGVAPKPHVEPNAHDEPSAEEIGALVAPTPNVVVGPNRDRSRESEAAPDPQGPLSEAAPEATGSKGSVTRSSPIALESELLQKALGKLCCDHDARSALALFDDYRARFPQGSLLVEASVARVDALMLMGRRSDALALLTRLPLDRVGRPIELQLLRAELQAERDCSRALPDFDAVLAAAVSSGLGERALYGRAACRLRTGDAAAGRADLQAYLTRYPNGRFVEQVRAHLATTSTP